MNAGLRRPQKKKKMKKKIITYMYSQKLCFSSKINFERTYAYLLLVDFVPKIELMTSTF